MRAIAEPSRTPLQRAAEQCAEGESRYRDFLAYVRKTFHVGTLLDGVVDTRKESKVPTALVMRILFLVGLLRIPSFNALEPKLAKAGTQRALGFGRVKPRRVCSADTLRYVLKRIMMRTVRAAVVAVIKKAERNKVFREGWYSALRFVAIDGWEPISSFSRHCDHCLVRLVRKELHTGEVEGAATAHLRSLARCAARRWPLRQRAISDLAFKPHRRRPCLVSRCQTRPRRKETRSALRK